MTDPVLAVPTSNGRYYVRPERGSMPSITNIIGKKDKPGLKYWAMKECATYASQQRATLASLTEREAYTLVREAPFARSDDSPAAIGDIVHSMIERKVKNENAPSHDEVTTAHHTVRAMWQSFLKFEERYKPQYTGSEWTVWSDTYGYAGTMDLSFNVAGFHVLCDAKTGKNVYPETAMQLAAGAFADVVIGADGNEVGAVPKYDKYAILHLRPRSATLVPVDNIPAAWEAFKALKLVFDWDVEMSGQTLGFAPKVS